MTRRLPWLALVLLALVQAACSTPLTFRWPEQPIWPGQTRVFGSSGGALDVRVECIGPGDVTVVDAGGAAHELAPEQAFATRLEGEAELRIVNAVDGPPAAVSLECEMFETVQLRYEEVGEGAMVASRSDFDGNALLRPDEALTLEVAGELAVTTLADPRGVAVEVEPLEPIDSRRQLRFGSKRIYRGPVRLRLTVPATPATGVPLAIQNATDWSLRRSGP